MKFQFTSLGAIDEATIELAPLTVICGLNNTGKTYVTYAIYALLSTWRQLIDWEVSSSDMDQLFTNGTISIDLDERFVKLWPEIKERSSKNWLSYLPRALGAPVERFKETQIAFDFELDNTWKASPFKKELRSEQGKILFTAEKSSGSGIIEFAALKDKEQGDFPRFALEDFVSQTLLEAALLPYLPPVFMASAERTGAVIFKEELNLTKNKIVNFLATMDSNKHEQHPHKLFEAIYKGGYPLPVEHNVLFVNRFGSIEGSTSPLLVAHPTLAADFEKIAGGRYETNKEGVTHFVPQGSKTKLQLREASSAARSLVLIWYWLKSQAEKGHMLMVDEPELNLHPESQRAFARFLAKLVNLGVQVFITTHSDTMLREFNTLIMLARNLEHINTARQKYGYSADECLTTNKIRLYVANGKPLTAGGRAKKGAISTLESIIPGEKLGLAAAIFDNTINEMGEIQDAVRYGAI